METAKLTVITTPKSNGHIESPPVHRRALSPEQIDRLVGHGEAELKEVDVATENAVKDHLAAADGYVRGRICAAMLSAVLASGSGLSVLMGTNKWLVATASLIAALLTGVLTITNPAELAKQHRQAADQYRKLRTDIDILVHDICTYKIEISDIVFFSVPIGSGERYCPVAQQQIDEMAKREPGSTLTEFQERMVEITYRGQQLIRSIGPLHREQSAIDMGSPLVPSWANHNYGADQQKPQATAVESTGVC
jgi:hypothetical protein